MTHEYQLSAQQLTQKGGNIYCFFQNYTTSKFTIAQNQTLFFHQFSLTFSDLVVILAITVHERCTQDSSVVKTQGSRTRFLFSYYSAIPENLFKGYFFTAGVGFGVAFSINFFSSSAFLASEKLWSMTPCPLRLVSFVAENF